MNEQKICIEATYQYKARRIWIKAFGPVPAGLIVCHSCDNPKCVNLEHLFLGTPKDNTQDMLRKKRHWVRKGSEHYRAKLTDSQIAEIKQTYQFRGKKGNDGPSLARKYQVTEQTITRIIRGVERSE